MTTAHVKAQIKKKFGTISSFARVAGIDRYELQKMFARESLSDSEQKELIKKITIVDPEQPQIDPLKLELLKSKIEEYGGIYKFGKDFGEEFNMRQLYQIYNGEMKTLSKQVKKLFDHFKIE